MMILREITIWICQLVLFMIGIGIAALSADLGGDLVAWAFDINDIIPTALIFFTVAAALGWVGNRFWPETWLTNPLLEMEPARHRHPDEAPCPTPKKNQKSFEPSAARADLFVLGDFRAQ
jgi:hypothetical protein